MDIDCGAALSFQCRIGLHGDQNVITDAIALHDHFGRSKLYYFAVDVIYHSVQNVVRCKNMTKSCKIMRFLLNLQVCCVYARICM